MECVALADALPRRRVRFLVEDFDPAVRYLRERKYSAEITSFDSRRVAGKIMERADPESSIVVIDHRAVRTEDTKRLRKTGARIAVIDQLGAKVLSCDLLVNSTPVEQWHRYGFLGNPPIQVFGPEFVILRPEFLRAKRARARHGRNSPTGSKPSVLVTMGGVDRTGATIRIAKALLSALDRIRLTLVLGPAFPHEDELRSVLKRAKYQPEVVAAPPDLAARMASSDLVISAGGNTLYEAAYLGVPALVLWEDPHERIQGEAFERLGSAIVIGNGMKSSSTSIRNSVLGLVNRTALKATLARVGKKRIDGRGAARVAGLLASKHRPRGKVFEMM